MKFNILFVRDDKTTFIAIRDFEAANETEALKKGTAAVKRWMPTFRGKGIAGLKVEAA